MKEKNKYGTVVMSEEECLEFAATCIDNGSSPEEAIKDMRMIDTLLAVERTHLLSHPFVRKTASGRYRKGTALWDAFEGVINARVAGIEM